MAEIVRYVDTGADAGGNGQTDATSAPNHAYQSLNQWEAAEETDLDTANNTHVVHCNRTNGGAMDDTALSVYGWTTSDTDFITIIADDFPVDGIFDNTKYVLHNDDSAINLLDLFENYVRVRKLQVQVTETSTNSRRGLAVAVQDADNLILIDSCIIKGICSGTGEGMGILVADGEAIVTIYNTVLYGFFITTDSGFRAIECSDAAALNIYNCTIYGNTIGISRAGGTVTAKNCAIGNNEDDINGTVTADYNCDDDNDGTNNQSPNGGNWTNEFNTAGSDFSLKSGGNCVGNGTDNPGAGLYSDDIIDAARSSTWDIGAFELAAVGGNAGIMTPNTGFWGPSF